MNAILRHTQHAGIMVVSATGEKHLFTQPKWAERLPTMTTACGAKVKWYDVRPISVREVPDFVCARCIEALQAADAAIERIYTERKTP